MPKIISRAEAIEQGLTNYFTGKPCKNGHLSTRNVKSKVCSECHKINLKKYQKTEAYKKSKKKANDKFLQSLKDNPSRLAKVKSAQLEWRTSEHGKSARKKYMDEYVEQPEVQKRMRETSDIYRKSEKGINKKKEFMTEYTKRPDVRAKMKKLNDKYRKSEEGKAQRNAWMKSSYKNKTYL